MKNTRRELVRELSALVRCSEPGSTNLGRHVADHAEALAPVLRATPEALRLLAAQPDEHLASRLQERLRGVGDVERAHRATQGTQVAQRAAVTLGATARWTELGAVLDVNVLLGDLLSDAARKLVVFSDGVELRVAIKRLTLVAVARLRRRHLDLAAYVSPRALHFRWKGGRGGYNFVTQSISKSDAPLVVELRRRAEAASRASRGAWLGEVLHEMGYPT